MKIVIDGQAYDPNDTPILVVLTDLDKNNIHQMSDDKYFYFAFPGDMDAEEAFQIKEQFKKLAK